MTKQEISQLLYLESRAVDYAGRVAMEKMNDDDRKLTENWAEWGFIKFGRIRLYDCTSSGTHWVELSDAAWAAAHEARKARGVKAFVKKGYQTTEEGRQAG